MRKYVARRLAISAIPAPAIAPMTSAALSTSRTRPIVFSNVSLSPVSSSTVSYTIDSNVPDCSAKNTPRKAADTM